MKQKMKIAAHLAAQSVATGCPRSEIKKLLSELGFGSYILSKDSDEFLIQPVAHGRSGDSESWMKWALFDLDELKAYAKDFGQDWFEPATWTIGEKCECWGSVENNNGWWRCQLCGNYFEDQAAIEDRMVAALVGWYEFWGGPGRAFAGEPWISRKRGNGRRVLIKWCGGLDN